MSPMKKEPVALDVVIVVLRRINDIQRLGFQVLGVAPAKGLVEDLACSHFCNLPPAQLRVSPLM